MPDGYTVWRTRFFVTEPGRDEQEVSEAEWCQVENANGFHSKFGSGHPATGGFTGPNGTHGRVTYTPQDVVEVNE